MSHPMRKTWVSWRPLTNLLILVHLPKQCVDLSIAISSLSKTPWQRIVNILIVIIGKDHPF